MAVWLVKYKTPTPGHLVSPLFSRGLLISTILLSCLCHSDGSLVLLCCTFYKVILSHLSFINEHLIV